MIDNYDSFTYNLVQYLQTLGAQVKVIRNDELSVPQIAALSPERIVISPGPCTPNEAGVCVNVIRELGPRVPILGVCLWGTRAWARPTVAMWCGPRPSCTARPRGFSTPVVCAA